jgi:hypothetical protein
MLFCAELDVVLLLILEGVKTKSVLRIQAILIRKFHVDVAPDPDPTV